MKRIQRFGWVLGLVVGALAVFTGCAQKSPLEKMIENRARYSADVNSFYVDEVPVAAEVEPGMEGEPEGDAAPETGEMDDMELEPAPVEVTQRANLDLLIKHDSYEKLAGITLDIIQVDVDKNEKNRWLHWVDTSKVERANPTSFSYVIEDVDYVEGDGFAAEVRHPVPEAERGNYMEFANVGS